MKIIRTVLFYLWQFSFALIQNLMGLALFAFYKIKGAKTERFHHAVITRIDAKNFGGMSLGIFIFINNNKTGGDLHDIRIHEYGHTIQCMLLGPLWLFLIALPSVIWCDLPYFRKMRKEKDISYYRLYCEGWANVCGVYATKDSFVTPEYINRGRYGKPM